MKNTAITAWALLSIAGLAAGQELQDVVQETDFVFGVGEVTSVGNLAVNDSGTWQVEVDTDNEDNDVDEVILRNGLLTLQEGFFLVSPQGVVLDAFNDMNFNNAGHTSWVLDLSDTPGNKADDTGIYWDTLILVQEGGPVQAPEVSSDTVYTTLHTTKINDLNYVLAVVEIDDLEVEQDEGHALVLLETDGSGNLLSESVLVKEGDLLDSQLFPVASLETGDHGIALNARNDVMYGIQTSGPGDVDQAIYLNDTLIAAETGASPIEGRNWKLLGSVELDLNDDGDWVFGGNLDGDDDTTNALIELSGQKFVQKGDVLEAMAPFGIENFGSAPIFLSNGGDVFWYGKSTDLDNPATDQFYFRNYDAIIQEGVTTVGGVLVTGVRGNKNGFAISDSGRYWVGEVTLQGIGDAVVFADFGLLERIDGCGGNDADLTVSDGLPVAGDTLNFKMDGAQGIGVQSYLGVSTRPVAGFPPCGIPTNYGELLIDFLDPGNPVEIVSGPLFDGEATDMPLAIPDDPSLVDLVFYAQGFYFDPGGTLTGTPVRSTNAMSFTIGAP